MSHNQTDSDIPSVDTENLLDAFKNLNSVGGSVNDDFPTGGFPPILKCKVKDNIQKKNENREFTKGKKGPSIKDVLKQRITKPTSNDTPTSTLAMFS